MKKERKMKKFLFPILAVVLALSLGTTGAFAAVSSTQDGDVCGPDISSYTTRVYIIDNSASKIDANPVIATAPTNVTLHMYESDTETRVFNEKQNVLVTGLAYDGSTYTGNVDSHLIHQEPTMGEPGIPTNPITDAMRGRGCISFATNIIGVITSDSLLDASDSVLGLSTTTYPAGQVNRGLEMGSDRRYQDIILVDGNTIRIDLQSAEVMDQIRVLTEPVDPDIAVEKTADSTSALEGGTITYTYTVTNTGNVPLSNVTVTDPDVDTGPTYGSGDTNTDGVLDLTETWVYTAEYTVPWFTAGPVENTGTANADYDSAPVGPVTDDESVDILHNPAVELTKVGPDPIGYFETVDALYTYTVENTGDCSLDVTLTDSMIAELGDPAGDANTNELLDPDEIWTYTVGEELICEGDTMTIFTNTAIVVGEDVLETQVWDMACWNVVVFQWQPRTIGYWGNWDNHYSQDEWDSIRLEAIENSPNIEALAAALTNGELWNDWYGEGTVHDFLLGPPPKLNGTAKAEFLMEKQFLAAWLNVKAYEDWVNDSFISGFTGSGDAAMDLNATVYLSGDAATLFGGEEVTVMDILTTIEDNKGTWYDSELSGNFKTAQEVLDRMNNAEDNNYEAFMDPDFDPDECSTCLLVGDWALVYNDTINHSMSITTQNPDGTFSGTGAYATPPPPYTWDVTGTVTDSTVSMTIDYDQQVGGEDYSVSLTGTMSDCDTMNGTATDSKANSYTWTATRT